MKIKSFFNSYCLQCLPKYFYDFLNNTRATCIRKIMTKDKMIMVKVEVKGQLNPSLTRYNERTNTKVNLFNILRTILSVILCLQYLFEQSSSSDFRWSITVDKFIRIYFLWVSLLWPSHRISEFNIVSLEIYFNKYFNRDFPVKLCIILNINFQQLSCSFQLIHLSALLW